eukprot:scaffold193343_cov18-Prasinocladus_malaysianus.AAC.1
MAPTKYGRDTKPLTEWVWGDTSGWVRWPILRLGCLASGAALPEWPFTLKVDEEADDPRRSVPVGQQGSQAQTLTPISET